MGLSKESCKKALGVFKQLEREGLAPLYIPSKILDQAQWTKQERVADAKENIVYGWDKKIDGSWENLFFLVKRPSPELIRRFDELKGQVPNSSMSRPDRHNPSLWIFGWF